MALKGRSKDPDALDLVNEAVLCRIFRCRPSELADENFEKLLIFSEIYSEIGKKNPLIFM